MLHLLAEMENIQYSSNWLGEFLFGRRGSVTLKISHPADTL